MSFKFPLERVLDYRRQQEDRAAQILAEAVRQQETTERHLAGLEAELALQQQALAGLIDAGQRWLTVSFIKALREDREQARARLELLREETLRCRNDLAARAQERKLLETLKNKQAGRYAQEEKLREQREYDEAATIRRGRKADAFL